MTKEQREQLDKYEELISDWTFDDQNNFKLINDADVYAIFCAGIDYGKKLKMKEITD